jgi:hypothetical protein
MQVVNLAEPQYKFTVTLHNSLLDYCDIFFFDYGVTIFWNLPENLERILISLTKPFQRRALPPKDWRIEDFLLHFQRNRKEGIYNDVIRLRCNRGVDKFTLSHAIGQSTKLLLLEDRMDANIEQIEHVPKVLAEKGTVGMAEEKLRALIGTNLKLKMDINLLTNVTDVPEIFRSMPSQTPLYQAARSKSCFLSMLALSLTPLLRRLLGNHAKNKHPQRPRPRAVRDARDALRPQPQLSRPLPDLDHCHYGLFWCRCHCDGEHTAHVCL